MTDLIAERAATHGNFRTTARISRRLKEVIHSELRIRSADGRVALAWHQEEALDMICVKIARVISGDPDCKEHWLDIDGYSELGAS